MKTRFAFVGFRHGHIFDLLSGVEEHPETEIVGCCEEDAATRLELAAKGRVTITHPDFATLLREVDCEVIAIGDCFARRGALAIAALRAGRHVLSDKPLCTTLAEQEQIEALAAERGLTVGLQLDCRDSGAFRTLRAIIASGEIGEVTTIHVNGQHPLLLGIRPAWFFEPSQHGGTINDIGIHSFDLIPWMTGLEWRGVVAARTWNAKARDFPHFHDCAQIMGVLCNGAGVLADYSYLAPDKLGYQLPHYWQVLVHGSQGLVETHLRSDMVSVITDASTSPELRPAMASELRGYLGGFLRELHGGLLPTDLTSAQSLRASRLALEAELAARP